MDLDFLGQTLDGKYHVTRELGRGGMGTVYLATHLGTERPVAVKIISPEFMERDEFVERFRREAKAAGRLRHPNVVNVTDFGFSGTKDGQVAYLVMEYLDGCTLGEILDEEKNLPVAWSLDILEQVCSAVHEAHGQGIIHRDLKPDNIWLEPNQRGGYTVKVLDFGIAKLEEHAELGAYGNIPEVFKRSTHTLVADAKATYAGVDREGTQAEAKIDTRVAEATTIAQTVEQGLAVAAAVDRPERVSSEGETAIFDDGDISAEFQDAVGTRISDADAAPTHHRTTGRSLYESSRSAELTRVGAVLGTPLYMSPEQCRGEHLDPRSDIYSLGVIAYQMLSGAPPFEGDFKDVMQRHKSAPPPPLKAKGLRRKLKSVILSTLEKDPDKRPQTAEAFSSELRSRSEGIYDLLRRALVIYSEHLPKFLMLTTFFSLPMIGLTLVGLALAFLKVSDLVPAGAANVSIGIVGFILWVTGAFCTNLIVGTIAWIVTQYLSVPLRPIRLRPALAEARKKWKRIAGAGVLTALLPFVVATVAATAGFLICGTLAAMTYPVTESVGAIFIAGAAGAAAAGGLAFLAAYITWILVPPIVVMENVGVVQTLRRSRGLVKRSFATAAGVVFIMFLIPALIAGTLSLMVNVTAKAIDPTPPPGAASAETPDRSGTDEAPEIAVSEADEKKANINFSLGRRTAQLTSGDDKDMRTRVKNTILESLIQLLWLPMQILVLSFSGIIVALLYLKTRLAGGESMNDLIERFEDDGRPRKKWQERVRQRLIQSGRIPSRS